MADNIDKWHNQNIVDNGFENDNDFECLKASPNKFEKKLTTVSDDDLNYLRKGTFKFHIGNRNTSFRGLEPASPRKRISKKAAANARGQKY